MATPIPLEIDGRLSNAPIQFITGTQTIYAYIASNTNNQVVYIKLYDKLAVNVNSAADVPLYKITVPAATSLGPGLAINDNVTYAFTTAISARCTVIDQDRDTTSPSTAPSLHVQLDQTAGGGGGGDALVANPLSQFAATTSTQLRGVISDPSGTGAAVFATSPTLTTPNLGTPSAATLTNATGLPVATGVSGLGTGIATMLASPTSANVSAALPHASASQAGILTATDFATLAAQSSQIVAVTNPANGTLTISAVANPPVNRVALTTLLTGNLNIVLPPAANYTSATGYQAIEFIDIVGGVMSTNAKDITITRLGSDTIDGLTSINMPRGSTYLAVYSDGVSKWSTTQYYVAAFKDPTTPTKKVAVDVSNQTASAGFVFRPARLGDSVSVQPYTPVSKQWLVGVNSDGVITSTQPKSSDILPVQYTSPAGTGTVTVDNNGTINSINNSVAITGSSRSFIFPDAQNYDQGEEVRFIDSTGTVSAATLARIISDPGYSGGGNTFNGQATLDISEPYCNRVFIANPATGNWTVSTFGGTTGSGLSLDTWHLVTPVSNIATITVSPTVIENHHIVSLSAATAVAFAGTILPGATGVIKFRDSTGAHVVTPPNSLAKTPITSGTGVFTTSTGTNVEDVYRWDFDGTNYNFYPIGLKMIAAAPPSFATTADDTTTAQSTTASDNVGDTTAKHWRTSRLLADGAVTDGSNYTIGKIRLRALKVGSPTYNAYCEIRTDNGSAGSQLPTATVVGSISTAVATSGFPASEGDVDFDTNATLIGARQVTSITPTNTSPTITGAAGKFLAGDVGTIVSGTGIPIGAVITGVAGDGSSATMNVNATSSPGAVTVTVRHVYWIVLHTDVPTFDGTNYIQWAYHTGTNQNTSIDARSQANVTWVNISFSTQLKYITFK